MSHFQNITSKGHEGRISDGELSELSVQSEKRHDFDQDHSEKFFSFNQSFTNIQQNQKVIHQKTASISKIRSLEDELKSCKSRSGLWEKAKSQIMALNKFLKLSSISLGCSDAAILKEFFEKTSELVAARQDRTKEERSKASEIKKKEADLFEKLVESNKRKYELEQRIVQYQHQISKLTDVNDSLREKSRAQSTERSSKIREFHEETLMTLHQKDEEMTSLQDQNHELKLQLVRLHQQAELLQQKLASKESNLTMAKVSNQQLKVSNQQLQLECQLLKKQLAKSKEDEKQTDAIISEIKVELEKLVSENLMIRGELQKRGESIVLLRGVIQDAKLINDQYQYQLQTQLAEEQTRRKENISRLLEREELLKKNIRSNIRFGINRKHKRLVSSTKQKIVISSQSLLI